ncbi:DNA replication complex GINS protein PSF3 [Hondaea fermentalgiana]|uniref:DNA replication complex GINS protein PSF3 n=1 Tax=Hondaea fermentalgiana TaxID=2315210 RepID=A0A2R5G683_9STRA|nr:DNA replication complex GINS protein PSF3 [Hondaea fermentalgiana]|eukprot:GBG25839.1 DNA replication complex GINS protein PSF3 [Hondaea fermentalgiana]
MASAYYDLDAILAEEERVPTTFLSDAQDLGILDSSSDNDDLSRGTKAELPLWLATTLAERIWVKLELPRCYQSRFRTYLLADPTVVALSERSPTYYETGFRLASFVRESSSLCDSLIRTLATRFKGVIDKAQNSRNEDISSLTRSMTAIERRLFDLAHQGSIDILLWKQRDSERIHSARGMKRKLGAANAAR